jgi:hypothetical protein
MKRRGREVCRGLGDLGDQLRLMGGPAPAIQSGPPGPGFIVGDFAAERKASGPRHYQWGPEGLAGRLGVHRRSLHPGTGFRPPFHVAYIAPRLASVRSVTELAAQLGHARKSMTLDTYAHVLLDA